MKVKILIEFEVEGIDEEDPDMVGLDEAIAKGAASQAAYDYLSFCTVSGVNTDTEEVTVYVDGYGTCKVRLGSDHE
jgi:hypothetical protein